MSSKRGIDIEKTTFVVISGDINGDLDHNTRIKDYLKVLKKYQIKATFPTTLEAVTDYTDKIKYILVRGHEIAGHGDVHKRFHGTLHEQTQRLLKMKEGIHDILGVEIEGFRAPWCKWDRNTHLALSKVGIKYDSNIKKLELLFRLPYINKKNTNVLGYRLIKPFLRLGANLYNLSQKCQKYPYFIAPNLLEIPVLGYSDYYLTKSPDGPKYTEFETEKIAQVWLENLKCLIGGGVLVINAHPGFFSPTYLEALDYFIKESLEMGVKFETLNSIASKFSGFSNKKSF